MRGHERLGAVAEAATNVNDEEVHAVADLRSIHEVVREQCVRQGPHVCDEGWICEAHPEQPFPHDDCPGPGMPCGELVLVEVARP